MRELHERVAEQVARVVVGQDEVVRGMLAALAVGGHVLLEGPPGTAKTLLANAVARALRLDFNRVQCTPDMLPSDITGTTTLRGDELAFRRGPVFTNVLLADEINRTPPKTQAALLEAMGEGQVTADGEPRPLPDPFLVVATQNPIEFEGTYPLPEAQLDRFLVRLDVTYPSEEDERAMLGLGRTGLRSSTLDDVEAVVGPDDVLAARRTVDAVRVDDDVAGYVVAVVRATRGMPAIELGASPRAAVHLLAAGRARAALEGRDYLTPDDVATVAPSVLGHRLVLRPEAQLERYDATAAIRTALGSVPVPR